MIPVAFDGCAGFLHLPKEGAACGRGVVICHGFGYEGLCTHRAMITLAAMLADAGLPTLRFHYPGTEDSAGDEAPGQIDRWIGSIADAMRHLREVTGVGEVALLGFRLGGLMAIEAARRSGDVCALALLAPVVQGRAYVRELILSGSMIAGASSVDAEGWHEILGYRLHAQDLERLRGFDIPPARMAEAAPRTLWFSPHPQPGALAPSIEFEHFWHYDGLLQHTQFMVMPLRVFRTAARWLRSGAPAAGVAVSAVPAPARLEVAPGVVETLLRFGPGDKCFGVLTQPQRAGTGDAVLILNTGLNYHTGNGRNSVRLARRLAEAGVAVLRVDMDGIGESAPRDAARTVGFHDLARMADVTAALDLLEDAGFPNVLLTGLCAGAYIGLHAAAADPRIAGTVFVNLPHFYVREEDPAHPSWLRPRLLAVRLLDVTRRWRDALFRGRRPLLGSRYFHHRLRVSQILLALRYRSLSLRQRVRSRLIPLLPEGWTADVGERLMRAIAARGIVMTLVYSSNDWVLIELAILFGDYGEKLKADHLAEIRVIDGADHSLTARWMFEESAQIIEERLGLRTAAQPPATVDA